MKDETADNIASELRLIREELQKLTSAVKSIAKSVTELQ
jgi:prefoldin subunit 5